MKNFFAKHWKILLLFLIIGVCFLLWFLFPQPDFKLWPPKQKNEQYKIFVTIDDYHSCINFPDYKLGLFQEWHMGAKEWYLSKNSNVWEIVTKAAKGKVDAVLRFGVFARPYWERQKIDEKNVFTFWLTKNGFLRLNQALHKYRGSKMKRQGQYWYFPYTKGYYLLQNCNNFTSEALIQAGLPIRKTLAQEGISMAWQLRRCQSIQNKFLR